MDISNAKANYAAQSNVQYAAEPAMTASESIIARLNGIRMSMAENRSSASNAADKIVGTAPTALAGSSAPIKGEHPTAHCFIDALQQAIGDLEDIVRDTAEHLNRLHRSF